MAVKSAALQKKQAIVEEVNERLNASPSLILTEYRGLTVKEMEELRARLAEAGGSYKVVKNTLLRRALKEEAAAALAPLLTGPTAVAFTGADAVAVAKVLREFARATPALVVKGGLVEGEVLSRAQVEALADIPPREVILARLAGDLKAPVQMLANLLAAPVRSLAVALGELAKKRQELEGTSGA